METEKDELEEAKHESEETIEEEKDEEEEEHEDAFDDLRHDYKQSRMAKEIVDKLIVEWNDLYYGRVAKKKDATKKSTMVVKEVAKQIENMKPSLMEPFTSNSNPIRLKGTKNAKRSAVLERYLNHQFTGDFDRQEFMSQLSDVLLREGTVWVRTGWEFKEETIKEVIPEMTMDKVLERGTVPDKIKENDNGTFEVEFHTKEITQNNPTAVVERNEHIFPDPTARTMKDLRFIIVKNYLTISELREKGIYPKDKIDKLEGILSAESTEDTTLGIVRDQDQRSYGNEPTYRPRDKARRKVAILEYWGFYDLNGDGIAEPIVATWADRESINLRIEENPMPSKAIPFFRDVYSARPFSLWGNPPAFFLGDNQVIKTGLMRGILDNMSLANNGTKFVQRGSIDYPNFKKLKNGDRYVMVNKLEGIVDGKYNNLPPSVFNTLQLVDEDTKQLVGLDPKGMSLPQGGASSDGDSQTLTMSQQRMASGVRSVGGLLQKVLYEWLMMAEVFLSNEQIEELYDNPQEADILAFNDAKHAHITVKVGTDVSKSQKAHQINMLMQQSKVLGENTPPNTITELTAELFEVFDMYEKAEKIRAYKKPAPSQQQMAMQRLSMQKEQLEVAKLTAEIDAIKMEAQAKLIMAQNGSVNAQAGTGYKQAQIQEKIAKAQSHRVDSALKPVQAMSDMQSNQNKGN